MAAKSQGVEFQATEHDGNGPGRAGHGAEHADLQHAIRATARSTTGSRNSDGLSSEFFHVLIVAEPAKLYEP